MTLVEELATWLLEQIAERERRIQAAGEAKVAWATYRRTDGEMAYTSPVATNGDVWVTAGKVTEPDSVLVVFDPAVELADCDSKRRIVGNCLATIQSFPEPPIQLITGLAAQTLRLMATSYAHLPGYREEWWA